MARRYVSIAGLGRCTIVLEGMCTSSQQRVQLAYQVESGQVFLVSRSRGATPPLAPVAGKETSELLRELDGYDWWLPNTPIEEDENE